MFAIKSLTALVSALFLAVSFFGVLLQHHRASACTCLAPELPAYCTTDFFLVADILGECFAVGSSQTAILTFCILCRQNWKQPTHFGSVPLQAGPHHRRSAEGDFWQKAESVHHQRRLLGLRCGAGGRRAVLDRRHDQSNQSQSSSTGPLSLLRAATSRQKGGVFQLEHYYWQQSVWWPFAELCQN